MQTKKSAVCATEVSNSNREAIRQMYCIESFHLENFADYKDFFTQEKITQLKKILQEISKDTFFPNVNNIFRFMKTPISEIKCVFLGMEPYPSWTEISETEYAQNYCDTTAIDTLSHFNLPIKFLDKYIIPEATGRSFEVNSIKSWTDKFKQSSLRNILKSLYYSETGEKKNIEEIREKIISNGFLTVNPKDWFNAMEQQGVVFLNAALTVKMNEPNSHKSIWSEFMTDLIKYIEEKNPNIQWILAGNQARERAENLVSHCVITHHPRLDTFVRECPFQKIKTVNWIDCDVKTNDTI